MLIRPQRPWLLSEREATSEAVFLSRRKFLAASSLAFAGLACDRKSDDAVLRATLPRASAPYPFARNPRFTLDRPLTDELIAAQYNNFYEFGDVKDGVWKSARAFSTSPWTLEVTGLVAKPRRYSLEDLYRTFAFEERVYRHRCVEAWAMAVPWTGFPLRALLEAAEPQFNARFVRFISFSDPRQMSGVRQQQWYPWPYYEALQIDEAMNELTMLVAGVYGHALPKQHGAPVRLVVPWKYGYKSAKSIVRIELVEQRPHTFWNDVVPSEYSFQSNVDPRLPHPRWSQASERMIGTFDVRATLPYNGYGKWVEHLYR